MFQCDPYTANKEIKLLRVELRDAMPDNPLLFGWASYSQTDEDGIIRELLTRIGKKQVLSNTFVEIGCADGLENNTHQLLLDGYKGVWIDGSVDKISFLERELENLHFNNLDIVQSYVSKENTKQLLRKSAHFLGTRDVDFFSLDIDGNDYHILPLVLDEITPKIVCVEYNPHFPPPTKLAMSYSAEHIWQGDDYYGASLQSWVELIGGYTLVCCNICGSNAFFVRNDLIDVFTIYDINSTYQPPRYYLCSAKGGHTPSLKWLRQILTL